MDYIWLRHQLTGMHPQCKTINLGLWSSRAGAYGALCIFCGANLRPLATQGGQQRQEPPGAPSIGGPSIIPAPMKIIKQIYAHYIIYPRVPSTAQTMVVCITPFLCTWWDLDFRFRTFLLFPPSALCTQSLGHLPIEPWIKARCGTGYKCW